jgi:hypothetical protein
MKVLVTSPMRTGSTWVHSVLADLLLPEETVFVSSADEVTRICSAAQSCVLKSHSIIDLDLPKLHGKIHVVRVLRNYKDCLISRALYCRNVRGREGLPNVPAEDAIIEACDGLDDRAYTNVFVSDFAILSRWMEEVVVFERGTFDHTFYYEMLIHNPRDQFQWWIEKNGLSSIVNSEILDGALDRRSVPRLGMTKTGRFIGSAGVGQWMHWLDEPLWRQLDKLYLYQREIATQRPFERYPVSAPLHCV